MDPPLTPAVLLASSHHVLYEVLLIAAVVVLGVITLILIRRGRARGAEAPSVPAVPETTALAGDPLGTPVASDPASGPATEEQPPLAPEEPVALAPEITWSDAAPEPGAPSPASEPEFSAEPAITETSWRPLHAAAESEPEVAPAPVPAPQPEPALLAPADASWEAAAPDAGSAVTPPPPGWLPDPSGAADTLRYWDGSGWTAHVARKE